MNKTPESSRTVAARVVSKWLKTGSFPDRLIPPDSNDHGFIQDIVYGTVRWKRTLQWVLRKYVHNRPPPQVNSVLLIGAYQVLLRPDIPSYAAINETVQATRGLNARRTTGFVNAILRSIQRDREKLLTQIAELPTGLRSSHPYALVDSWSKQYGTDVAAALCAWDNQIPNISITTRPDGPDVTALLVRFNEAGIAAHPHPGAPKRAIEIAHGTAATALPGFDNGDFVVQDPATLTAVDMLDLQPGQRVLDACAAPGGKTVQIAARLQNSGEIVATELHEDRIPRLRANLKMAGVAHLTRILQLDATDPEAMKTISGKFHRILIDVPCSNTGVLRRRPDARWRYDPQRIKHLTSLQQQILDTTAPLLKPDGLLVYSTCSLDHRENEDVVNAWLKDNPGYRMLCDSLKVPTATRTDGAYAALIQRVQTVHS